ncbi:MAG TPA: hypothetical protein VLG27_01310 [Candidatus Saccharimonadia bacterium]|nr:hypothetical protein [Candidatus Saccharimonadia bacterium]
MPSPQEVFDQAGLLDTSVYETPLVPTRLKKQAAGVMATVATGATAGAIAANQYSPQNIKLKPYPGFDFTAQLSTEPGISATLQQHTELHLPHAPVHASLLNLGLHIHAPHLTLITDGPNNSFKALSTLASHINPDVVEPIKSAIIDNLETGAAIGVGSGLAAYALARLVKKVGLAEKLTPRFLRRNATALALSSLALGGCSVAAFNNDLIASAEPPHRPLPVIITRQSPLTKGAYATGIGKNSSSTSSDYVSLILNAKPFWDRAVRTVSRKYDVEVQKELWNLNENRNLIRLMQFGDIHSNLPAFAYISTVMQKFAPDIVAVNGDTQTNSGTEFYESEAYPDLEQAIANTAYVNHKSVVGVESKGNHDSDDPINFHRVVDTKGDQASLTTLEGSTTIDGLTIVGTDDPRHTTDITTPHGKVSTDAALAEQGSETATVACEVKHSTRRLPIVMTHSEQGSWETLKRGCAFLALNAHTHVNRPVNLILGPGGRKEYQHTVGTATGVAVGPTIYQAPVRDSTITMWYINRFSHRMAASITTVLQPSGKLDFIDQPLAAKPQRPIPYLDFLVRTYSPTSTLAYPAHKR